MPMESLLLDSGKSQEDLKIVKSLNLLRTLFIYDNNTIIKKKFLGCEIDDTSFV